MDVSENRGTPKSSILIGFSIINHPFWGFYPYFLETPYVHFWVERWFLKDLASHLPSYLCHRQVQEWNLPPNPRWRLRKDQSQREKSSLDIGWNVAGIKHVAYVVISIKCWKNNMTRPTTTSSLMSLFICLDDPSIYVFPGAKKKSAPFDEWLAPAFKMSVVVFPTNAGVAYTKMPWKNVIPKS